MRKMIGGATLYLDGTSFAILDEGEIWFKADAETDTIWDAEGCERFSMTFKDGRVDTMNYRRGPSDVYDEPEAMQRWAKLAVGAGRSEEHTSELQSLMRISYAVFCLKKKKQQQQQRE